MEGTLTSLTISVFLLVPVYLYLAPVYLYGNNNLDVNLYTSFQCTGNLITTLRSEALSITALTATDFLRLDFKVLDKAATSDQLFCTPIRYSTTQALRPLYVTNI